MLHINIYTNFLFDIINTRLYYGFRTTTKRSRKRFKIDNEKLDIESLKHHNSMVNILQIYTRWNLLSKQAESEYKNF